MGFPPPSFPFGRARTKEPTRKGKRRLGLRAGGPFEESNLKRELHRLIPTPQALTAGVRPTVRAPLLYFYPSFKYDAIIYFQFPMRKTQQEGKMAQKSPCELKLEPANRFPETDGTNFSRFYSLPRCVFFSPDGKIENLVICIHSARKASRLPYRVTMRYFFYIPPSK